MSVSVYSRPGGQLRHPAGRKSTAAKWSLGSFFFLLLAPGNLAAQQAPAPVLIRVQAATEAGEWKPVWNYFGYDEPNYTYGANGQKLLGELARLSPVPVYVRAHNLFTTGDGTASLKWGSTNVYSEDASGNPVFDWTIVDRIFDAYRQRGIKPLVELGFMPQALSRKPEPYRHDFPKGSIYTGWAYPPTDYQKWGNLVGRFVEHLRDRYGAEETKSWLWEVWNEPDIEYWKGTREEYFKLYDFASSAVAKALPGARIGGPDTTGPGSDNAAEFLRLFLEHCARQPNYATGKIGSPVDFVSFHPKGRPAMVDEHVRMGMQNQLAAVERGFRIVASFPEWRNTPIILGESDPEGCAACSAREHPQNAYRNGPLFASYTAAVFHQISALAAREHVNLAGAVTWSFEFEDQPYFAGFRELATNGIDKPVLNAFRMFGLLGGKRLAVESTGARTTEEFLKAGVREEPDINAIATRRGHEITVLAWHYHEDELAAPDRPVALTVSGIPAEAAKALVEHFRVDGTHSNAYARWQELGSPQQPSGEEYGRLEAAGHLQLLASPEWAVPEKGRLTLEFRLPRQSLSLLRISW